MVQGDTKLESEFAKIYNRGIKKTLSFFKDVLSNCPVEIRSKFEQMVIDENNKNMETTEIYKKIQSEYENIYTENSIKTLKFIEKNMGSLPEDVLGDIFAIIKKNSESFTTKKKEILVNLGSLKEDTIQEIVKFILFIRNSMHQLDSVSQKLNEIKDNFTTVDAVEEPPILKDPSYKPILHDYNEGPAPIITKTHA